MILINYLKQKEQEAEKLQLDSHAIKFIIANKYYSNYNNFITNYNSILTDEEINEYNLLLDKYLISNISPQYIVGYTYFYGLKIKVTNYTLIPRPETEVLLDKGIEVINELGDNLTILDLCTGSGCIAIALKNYLNNKNMTNSIVFASDISNNALAIAKENAIMNNVNINFIESDLFTNINNKFDIIICNPPYIPNDSKEVEKIVLDNEPSIALFAPDNGLYYYKRIINEAINYLKNSKYLIFEIGYDQGEVLKDYTMKLYPNSKVNIYKDYQGHNRILVIKIEE